MLKIKSEIDTVIQSANAIGTLEEAQQITEDNTIADSSEIEPAVKRKRAWLSSVVLDGGATTKKKARASKFKVIYRKK